MKVRELIEELEVMDQDAEVLIASQPHWPFEYSISAVNARHDVEEDCEEDEERPDGTRGNDVIIAEGTQLRYGKKSHWG